MRLAVGLALTALLVAACLEPPEAASEQTQAPIPVSASELEACGVDDAARVQLLSLTPDAFDQDPDSGWRPVANQRDCELAAATLLDAYITVHEIDPSKSVMHWHVGQLLALAGENQAAIPWLEVSQGDLAWSLYVDGTIAFLASDRPALEDAVESLAATPVPAAEKAMRRQFLEENPDFDAPDGFVDEPQNLGVLQGLLDCFEETYLVAYGCRPQP